MSHSSGSRRESIRRRRSTAFTVTGALDEQAAKLPDLPFLIVGDRRWSFAEVRTRGLALASGIAGLGLPPHSRVAFLSANRPDLVVLEFGIAYAGHVTVPINVELKGEFLSHQLIQSSSAAIAVDRIGLQALTPVLSELRDLTTIILLDRDLSVDGYSGRVVYYDDLFHTGVGFTPIAPAPADPMMILYTSGTTGPSKGCVLSHAYMIRVGRTFNELLDIGDDDVQICILPMFHMSGQMNLLMALCSGTPVSIESRFSASRFLDRAREIGATFWAGIGPTVDLLLKQEPRPDDLDNPLTKWIGVPLSVEAVRNVKKRFGIQAFRQLYAQTEANPVSSTGMFIDAADATDGRVLDDIEVKIVDDELNVLPHGHVGEILVRAREPGAMFSGYWMDGKSDLGSDGDQWHHTGDLGRLDEHGQLTFVDRKKDSMRRRGENVSAMELDRALLAFPAIAEVATHGVKLPDQLEEDIKACVVVRDGLSFDLEEFARFVEETVPYFAIPRFVEVLPALPRNPIGRVQKFELRKSPLTESTVDLIAAGLLADRRVRRSVSRSSDNTELVEHQPPGS